MHQLNVMLQDILDNGTEKTDRTGVGTISKFGHMARFPLHANFFPLPTGRKVALHKPQEELKWFLSGSTHVGELIAQNNHIWDSWMGQDGTIGPMYGEQWRNWTQGLTSLSEVEELSLTKHLNEHCGSDGGFIDRLGVSDAIAAVKEFLAERNKPFLQGGRSGIDQIANLINELKVNPTSRRLVVSTWNTSFIPDPTISPNANVDAGNMALAPCHTLWQVYVAPLSDRGILEAMTYEEDIIKSWIDKSDDPEVADIIMRVVKDHVEDSYYEKDGNLNKLGIDAAQRWKNEGRPQHELSLMLYARSQDVPLGTVFNIATYAMLTKVLAKVTNMVPKEYIHVAGDYHIYKNQVPFVKEQLSRAPMRAARAFLPDWKSIDEFDPKEIVYDYVSHPAIKYPMAAV